MEKPSILLVEDDLSLRLLIENYLKDAYQVTLAPDLSAAYLFLEEKVFDLVIVDRGLPDGDGLELITYLHENAFAIRTILLTYKSTLADRTQGLQKGADDYICKPFGIPELLLRIGNLLAKDKKVPSIILKSNIFNLDLVSGLVTTDGWSVLLRKREVQILAFLMRRRNQVISREHLMAGVWGTLANSPSAASLDVYMRRIRVKLGVYAYVIRTHRSFGYSFYEPADKH